MVWSTVSGYDATPISVRQLRYQCQDCGELIGSGMKHALARRDTPEVDVGLLKRGLERREQERQAQWRQFQEQRAAADRAWWSRYNEYLGTSAWSGRRALVLKRANGICEGRMKARATQVHHKTYQHVTNEFLWELVAICDDCHERFHEEAGNA